MIPRLLCDAPRQAARTRRLGYIGKFDADYMSEEMIASFAALRERFGDAELIVAGDKFHDPEHTGGFERRVRAALESTPGVTWKVRIFPMPG